MTHNALPSKSSDRRPVPPTLRRWGLSLLLPATLLFAACVGNLGDPASSDGSTGSAGHDGDGDGDGGSGPGAKACTTKGIGPGAMRRLTSAELRATVEELAGIPIDDIELQPDLQIAEFDSNAQSPTQWVNAANLRDIAEKVGMYVRNNVQTLAPCTVTDADSEKACLSAYLDDFGKRAFRRPLTQDERDRYQALYLKARNVHGLKYGGGIRLVTEAMLQSPSFAYHVELGQDVAPVDGAVPLTGHEMAARLSYFMLGTMPDEALFKAAASGELESVEGIAAQVDRLLETDAGKKHIDTFFHQWLGLRDLDEITRSPAQYPAWSDDAPASMRASTEMFIDDVMWKRDGLYSTMFRSPSSYVNAPLAKILGLEGTYGSDFQRVELDAEERPGILSHPSILTLTSHPDQSSPVLRGKFVLERLTCSAPPPPPANLVVAPLPLDPTLTTRERLEKHVSDPSCASCHNYMDPIGFTMEKYDAIGAHRDTENGKPVDDSGQLPGSDVTDPFNGLSGLTQAIVESNDAAVCAERKMMTFALGRNPVKGELCWLGDEYMSAKAGALDFRALARAIATSAPFRMIKKIDDSQCP